MTVSLYMATVNTAFAGLVLAFLLLAGYSWRIRKTVNDSALTPQIDRYYALLKAATIGSMFAFIGLFLFLWYIRVVPQIHDWVVITIDVLQIVFIVLVTLVGRELAKTMIEIQREYGI